MTSSPSHLFRTGPRLSGKGARGEPLPGEENPHGIRELQPQEPLPLPKRTERFQGQAAGDGPPFPCRKNRPSPSSHQNQKTDSSHASPRAVTVQELGAGTGHGDFLTSCSQFPAITTALSPPIILTIRPFPRDHGQSVRSAASADKTDRPSGNTGMPAAGPGFVAAPLSFPARSARPAQKETPASHLHAEEETKAPDAPGPAPFRCFYAGKELLCTASPAAPLHFQWKEKRSATCRLTAPPLS